MENSNVYDAVMIAKLFIMDGYRIIKYDTHTHSNKFKRIYVYICKCITFREQQAMRDRNNMNVLERNRLDHNKR